LTISLTNVAVLDQIRFPANVTLGSTGAPATVSLSMTFQKKEGTTRTVRPTSADPLSPFNWAGEMSDATYSGTFSVAYNDGKFSAQGSFGSTQILQIFAEMGTERNGSFVRHEDREEGAVAGVAALPLAAQIPTSPAASPLNNNAALPASVPKFRGKVPVEYLVH
jgi:hypothetical protein